MASRTAEKRTYEVLLVSANVAGTGFRRMLSKSRNLVTVDLLWPRASIARKTSARECRFVRSRADFTGEEWAKRILFREDIDRHAAVAVAVSEDLSDEAIEKFLRLAAKFALRTTADFVAKLTVGISDVASAPIDALAAMSGASSGPKTICQGVADLTDALLPAPGQRARVDVPLHRPGRTETVGTLTLEIKG